MLTRATWLAALQHGDHVLLITPCAVHTAAIEGMKDGRLWLIWAHGMNCELGHSATWVNPLTGDNNGGNYRIEPVHDVVKREAFND